MEMRCCHAQGVPMSRQSDAALRTLLWNPGHPRKQEAALHPAPEGSVVVLQPEEGESLWQPLPSTGYITNKLPPYDTPYDSFSMGIQVLEPGAHIRRHAHERQHEVLFCYAGEGWAQVGEQRYAVRPETTILIGRAVQHKVQNTGPRQMRLLWMIAPAGLEDWFRAIGRPRRPGDAMPAPFERPADVGRSRRGSGSCGRERGRDGTVSPLFSRLARERTAGVGRLSVNENRWF
jgi:mannose-6-phosphate isomerase-like protein (cupin superfamily)